MLLLLCEVLAAVITVLTPHRQPSQNLIPAAFVTRRCHVQPGWARARCRPVSSVRVGHGGVMERRGRWEAEPGRPQTGQLWDFDTLGSLVLTSLAELFLELPYQLRARF
ncbi:hypothetical protein AMECASPLE_014341 [Ameca splendens]|uniref:Secreted protein n=1 Tax=Ameca splendens TaxID=208324 RepID=A0ABV0XQF3_9TELE